MAGGLKKPLKRSHRVGGIVKNVQLFLPKHIGFYFVFFFSLLRFVRLFHSAFKICTIAHKWHLKKLFDIASVRIIRYLLVYYVWNV